MSLQIQCPGCGQSFDLREARNDQAWRTFVALLIQIPSPVQQPLLSYLELFRPAKQPNVRSETALKLAEELLPLIKSQAIKRKQTTYAIPIADWAAAMTYLSNNRGNLQLPLKGNGYLLETLASRAEKLAAKAEADAIEKQRHALQRKGSGPQQVGSITPKTMAQLQTYQPANHPQEQPQQAPEERSGAHELYEPLPSISEDQAERNRERLRRLMAGDFSAFETPTQDCK